MTATEHAKRLFIEDAVSDEGRYPNGARIIAEDMPGADESVWRSLRERKPTVIVTAEAVEILLVPHPRVALLDLIDRVRSRTRVRVLWRHGGHTYGGLDSEIGREQVSELIHERELVGAH